MHDRLFLETRSWEFRNIYAWLVYYTNNKQSCRPFYYNFFYWLVYTAASLIVGLSCRLHMRYEEEGRQFDCFGRKEIENAQDISG